MSAYGTDEVCRLSSDFPPGGRPLGEFLPCGFVKRLVVFTATYDVSSSISRLARSMLTKKTETPTPVYRRQTGSVFANLPPWIRIWGLGSFARNTHYCCTSTFSDLLWDEFQRIAPQCQEIFPRKPGQNAEVVGPVLQGALLVVDAKAPESDIQLEAARLLVDICGNDHQISILKPQQPLFFRGRGFLCRARRLGAYCDAMTRGSGGGRGGKGGDGRNRCRCDRRSTCTGDSSGSGGIRGADTANFGRKANRFIRVCRCWWHWWYRCYRCYRWWWWWWRCRCRKSSCSTSLDSSYSRRYSQLVGRIHLSREAPL